MKTLKNTTIVAGIIVALFSLTAHAAEKPKAEMTKAEKIRFMENMGLNKSFETMLIEEYIQTQETLNIEPFESKIMIYDINDELIYQGGAETKEAILFKLKSDFLMEHEHVSYYRLHN